MSLVHKHIETITRNKIYESFYYKEQLFGANAVALIEKVSSLRYIGGCYGGSRQPTHFLCILCKLMQINPEDEIILAFLMNSQMKYLRILAAFYIRMVKKNEDVYTYLEPLYSDYSKIVVRNSQGGFELRHVDEIIHDLLTKDHCMDLNLGFLQKREILVSQGLLEERDSKLFSFDPNLSLESITTSLEEEDKEQTQNNKLRLKIGTKRKREDELPTQNNKNDVQESMSVEESNKLRAQLGLPLLQ